MKLKGRKVVVTGADGFIGSHLVEYLVQEGCHVRALVQYNSFNSWGWLDTVQPQVLESVEIISGDVRDPGAMRRLVEKTEVVFHLAALIAIPFSYHSPDSYVDTNIRGTLNILQAVRDSSVEKLLVTSTSEVYGTALRVPITEEHPLQGQSPYSATKIGADHLAESFYRSFGLPVTIVRPFNTYGPRQSARAFIPTIISQLLSDKTEVKLGSLRPTRDLVFVKDTAKGFAVIAEADNCLGKVVNIATQQEHSVQSIAEKLIGQLNPEARIVCDEQRVRPENSEVERLLGSNERLKALTGWVPETSIDVGLGLTIDWFKSENHRYKSDIYNL
jgi:NAD dependent epimerase/dehydratase